MVLIGCAVVINGVSVAPAPVMVSGRIPEKNDVIVARGAEAAAGTGVCVI